MKYSAGQMSTAHLHACLVAGAASKRAEAADKEAREPSDLDEEAGQAVAGAMQAFPRALNTLKGSCSHA